MNKLAAALAVAFLVVGLASGFALYQTAVSYDTATHALLSLSPGMVQVEQVLIPPIESLDEVVSVEIVFNVTNPTQTSIIVWPISFKLFNDRVGDFRPFPEKLNDRLVNLGVAIGPESRNLLSPGESVMVRGTLLVGGIVGNIEVLNDTDSGGNYHPFVTASMLAELEDTGIKRDIEGIFYSSGPEGVPPFEG